MPLAKRLPGLLHVRNEAKGDVSWTLPMAQISAATTFVPGVPAHSWQSAACAGMSIGRKGMVVAAKSLVLTAVDLFTDPQQVAVPVAHSGRPEAAAQLPRQQVVKLRKWWGML